MDLNEIVLSDRRAGSSARILAGFGFNCHSFRAGDGGEPQEVLWAAPGFAGAGGRASGSGIPLLFPFPGRIGGGRFEFNGKRYDLAAGDGRGNAIHGFVLDRPWEVMEQSATRAVGRFQASRVDPELLSHWPSDFVLTVTYALEGNALAADFEAENVGAGPLPCALGTHPYFRLPGATPAEAGRAIVTVPTRRKWELVDMIPTGRKVEDESARRLAAGMEFAATQFDDVFTDLTGEGGQVAATLRDAAGRRTVRIAFDDGFGNCVVYNPPHREAICIEPYGCVPDPFRLEAAGVATGLRVLQPGERFQARVVIEVT
jgi:aldose 1-epimerase